MKINKRNRRDLKDFFVKNAIPTEGEFADLIDGMLNQKDDGIAKLAGSPLSIEASGDEVSQKKAINFYKNFSDKNPSWVLCLNPRSDPAKPATAKPGFSISNSAGNSLLFIDESKGNVGIGTVVPEARLDVNGDIRTNVALISDNPHGAAYASFSHRNQGTVGGYALLQHSGGETYLNAPAGKSINFRINNATHMRLATNGHVGIGTSNPKRKLHIDDGGQISLAQANSVVTNSQAGIYWHSNNSYAIHRTPGTWTAPTYQQLRLDWDTGIVLAPGTGNNRGHAKSYVEITTGKGLRVTQGTVGIGTVEPKATLDVRGNIFAGNSDIYFTKTDHNHTGTGNTAGYAAIENAKNYDALMILGRAGTAKRRAVKLWDYLQVNGVLDVNGNLFEKLEVIRCGGRGDWGSPNHPIMLYFKAKLTGKPIGTMIRAIQDHPSWRGHYWKAWVDVSRRIRVIHNHNNTTHIVR